jgi:hypothetical protein
MKTSPVYEDRYSVRTKNLKSESVLAPNHKTFIKARTSSSHETPKDNNLNNLFWNCGGRPDDPFEL